MAGRRRTISRRARTFVGCESKSEIALIVWLQKICDANDLHVHLDRGPAAGGDTLTIVEKCLRLRTRGRRKGRYKDSLIILDRDRIVTDGVRGQQAQKIARREGIELIFSRPNFEGLLLRLFPGHERDDPPPGDSLSVLRRLWPGYTKPPIARDLESRFSLEDLTRAARFDDRLSSLLARIGITG